MTRLPILDAKTIERSCSIWALKKQGRRAVTLFIAIRMGGQQRYHTILDEIWLDPSYEKYLEKSNSLLKNCLMSLKSFEALQL